jgi:hypothetical protein
MPGMIVLSRALMATEVRSLLTVPTVGSISLTLVRVALSGLWLWYLLCCPVRDAFHQSRHIEEQSSVATENRSGGERNCGSRYKCFEKNPFPLSFRFADDNRPESAYPRQRAAQEYNGTH